jgi:hypothetical protein
MVFCREGRRRGRRQEERKRKMRTGPQEAAFYPAAASQGCSWIT